MNIYIYLLRRVLLVFPVLIGLSLITFSISRLVPGDPVGLAAGPQSTPAIRERMAAEFGLDRPIPEQYINYMSGVLKGNLGRSLYTKRDVVDELIARVPATLELTLAAIIFASTIGIPLGIISALHQDRPARSYLASVDAVFCEFPLVLAGDDLPIGAGSLLGYHAGFRSFPAPGFAARSDHGVVNF